MKDVLLYDINNWLWNDHSQIAQHKAEFLESVRTLHKIGYKLYGSMGTADYYMEHGIKVCKPLIQVIHYLIMPVIHNKYFKNLAKLKFHTNLRIL